MPSLLFEIWEHPETHCFEMSPVTQQLDDQRSRLWRSSVLRHSFRARSNFEAYQMLYDWHGWGRWNPEPEWTEQQFTGDEVAAQDRYLAIKKNR